jgi:23S rRNA (uracil1939-C5)-methyltransferase
MPIDVEIESLAFGGAGVGRHDGKAIFVPLAAPGDLARVEIVRDRPRYAEAEMSALLRPSPLRRPPPCPVFGTCGGCQWQQLPYPEQCRWKERIVGDLLRRQAKVAEPPVLPVVPSPTEWHNRSRVQIKCRQTHRRGSHFVVDVEECPITAAPLNDVLRLFRQWLPASPCPARIPQVDLECGDDGRVRAVVHVIGEGSALGDYLRPLAGRR